MASSHPAPRLRPGATNPVTSTTAIATAPEATCSFVHPVSGRASVVAMPRAMSAGGHSIDWYIGASSAMPPMSGLNTSMKATLVRLMMSATWAGRSRRCVIHTIVTVMRMATGTMSEMSPSQTSSLLAKSDRRVRASESM